MSDTPRDFGLLSSASLAAQSAWEYADHVWLETLLKQRKEILGRSAQRVIYEMDYMIEDGGYEITPQDIAEYTSWKKSYAVEEAGWDAQLSVSFPPFPWQSFFFFFTMSSLGLTSTGLRAKPHPGGKGVRKLSREKEEGPPRSHIRHGPYRARVASPDSEAVCCGKGSENHMQQWRQASTL
jgi:hypothetical protein